MGMHDNSNRETRKKKYAKQFERTLENKKRKMLKREKINNERSKIL